MAKTGSEPIRRSGRARGFRSHLTHVLALCTFFGSGIAVTTLLDATPASATNAITIFGTVAGQQISDESVVSPFLGVLVSDSNDVVSETATVSLSSEANGTLSNLAGGSYNSGVYTVTGSDSAVTGALQGLIFTPTAHQVAPNETVTTTFTILVTDTDGGSASDSTTTVTATAVNDPPVITGARPGQTATNGTAITPFSGVSISDADADETETVTVTMSSRANGTFSGLYGGTYNSSTGVYTVTGSNNWVTNAVDGLLFTPTSSQLRDGDTDTTFTINDTDTSGAMTEDSTTTVTVPPVANDGSGVMSLAGPSLVTSSTSNTLTFTYTAATGGIDDGTVDVVAPADFGAPQTTSSAAADYVSATGGATLSVSGQTIAVSDVTLVTSGTFTLTIANLTAPSTPETEAFATSERSVATGTLTALAESPSANVISPPATVVHTLSSQSITFSSSLPTSASVGGSYIVVATGGASGNPVTFTIAPSSTPYCSISGSTVAFIEAGSCVIDANQAGNSNYEPAPQSTQSFVIAKAQRATLSPSISGTSAMIGTRVTFTTNVTTAFDTPAIGGTVTFSVGDITLCRAPVSHGRTSCSATDLTRAGDLTVIATFSGSSDASAARSTFSLVVSRGKVTINGTVRTIGRERAEYTTTVRAAHAGFEAPKGSVIFFSGTRAICSAPLRGDTAHCDGATVSGVVTARYRPGADFQGATKALRT